MKLNKKLLGLGLSAIIFGNISCNTQTEKTDKSNLEEILSAKPNILFIAVDDLRPELNCYGSSHIISPNIDRLASEGTKFTRAYCNVPVSGASRASLLTGLRPTRHRFLSYFSRADIETTGIPTLPEYFKNNGYHTISNGKVFHDKNDSPASWSELWMSPIIGSWSDYELAENIKADTSQNNKAPAYEQVDVADTAYRDGKLAEKTVNDLKKLKTSNKPFFLAVGFIKPHLPFTAPKKYWDLYDTNKIKLPKNNYKPDNAPNAAMHTWGELRSYRDIPAKGPLTDNMAKKLIHGYNASVSYTDAQIGKVLDALKELELDKNTIVILWGDHGWNLREHGLWCKHCNFENSLNAPLIIKVPGIYGGQTIESITEFIDIYPSLCDLANLDLPNHLEGESLVKQIKNPNKTKEDYAICKFHDGVTYIKNNYFYTEYSDTITKKVYAKMLYDHSVDPKENTNISEKPENKELVKQLSTEMKNKWGKDFNKYIVPTKKH